MTAPTDADRDAPVYSQADLDMLGAIWLRQIQKLVKERDDALSLAAAIITIHGGERLVPSALIHPEHAIMRPVQEPCTIKGVERWRSEKIMLASSLVASES